MANEGTFVAVLGADGVETALKRLRRYPEGGDAAVIGTIARRGDNRVTMQTAVGGRRVLRLLAGGQLPRIC
jgi:hydrogenase expression/formation protein HypE